MAFYDKGVFEDTGKPAVTQVQLIEEIQFDIKHILKFHEKEDPTYLFSWNGECDKFL